MVQGEITPGASSAAWHSGSGGATSQAKDAGSPRKSEHAKVELVLCVSVVFVFCELEGVSDDSEFESCECEPEAVSDVAFDALDVNVDGVSDPSSSQAGARAQIENNWGNVRRQKNIGAKLARLTLSGKRMRASGVYPFFKTAACGVTPVPRSVAGSGLGRKAPLFACASGDALPMIQENWLRGNENVFIDSTF
jgi:hypothetical protein